MNYDDLKTGQKIQMFHHHNSIGNNYRWKDGIVDVQRNGKFFVPNNGLCTLLILPHRMDEIREPIKESNSFPFSDGVFLGFD